MAYHRTWAASRNTKKETGFRSGLEVITSKDLEEQGVPYLYEALRIPYSKPAFYLPDFILSNQAIILETKGAFTSEDRAKMLRVQAEHPNLDIRFLFSNPSTRIGKLSKTTYGAWCKKHRFPYAKGGKVPAEWLAHTPTQTQKEALEKLLYGNTKND